MDTGLRGKTALITGGSSGIGRALARALAAEGVHVALADRVRDEATLAELRGLGSRVLFIPTDVSIEAQVIEMVGQTLAEWGQLDLFINNAAITRHEPITHLTTDAWLATLHTNLSACLWACREVGRHMIARQQGSILLIGSTAQYTQAYGEAAYHIAKTGLRVYKNTLALELAPYGIRVNLLVPGHFVTPLTAGIPAPTAAMLRQQIPLRRFGDPPELGAAALLLLSDTLSPYTTGTELTVDGGLHLRPLPRYSDDELRALNQP